MGEIKSVKVDNWGVFFLQKLQNFFNKTDYCDLTLQFRDNSQLKVHRLVLSACTDYFNVLEQTCEVVDDAIIMPNGLQADVVVPIVNFMYTGTLEFELKMYNRLLRTAKDMNMTVLLKLLEAHRRTMEMHPPKASGQASPKPRRRTAAVTSAVNSPSSTAGRSLIQTNQGKRIVVGSNVNTQPNRNVTTGNTSARSQPVRQIGSTTFTRIKVENEQEINAPTTASGGYSLIKQSPQQQQQQQPTSPFEQLRKGYNNNKRPAVASFVSPPAKKPNLEDVKEFAEQQRMRKQIAAEYGDDDYDASNIMDDDTIHNDDDDDEMMGSSGQMQSSQNAASSASAGVQTVASSSSQQTQSEDPPGTTTIIVKHEGPDKPPTIVVKDNSNTKMNHAKIISEVLRQYPHLVRSNKNIKLKIMPNAGGQAQKIVVKKESIDSEKQMQPPSAKLPVAPKISESQHQSSKLLASNIVANRPKTSQQQQAEITTSGISNSGGTESSTSRSIVGSAITSAHPAGGPQKRRIDSKTMHALIALGAENTTGPWLCLRCGRNGHPISIPSYRGFRRHLINTHKEVIDPDLCEHCGWRSSSKRELHFHMQLDHKIKTNLYIFPECQLCEQMCIDSDGLNQHLIDSHPDENKQQCIYCNKIFPEELQLYTHMKTFHKKQALEDGIIDYSDDENQAQLALPPLPPIEYDQEMDQEQKGEQETKKVKILSDISLPIASSIIKTDSFMQQTTSEEYLHDQEHDERNTETKFVAADGSEVILTAEQRKEILSQLNQEHEGSGVVMVLNENQQQQQYGSAEMQTDQGAISQDENSQATTATNEEREDDDEEHIPEEEEHIPEDDNQIYNEMKSLHTTLDDSTTHSEAEGKPVTSVHEEEHEHEAIETEVDRQERTEHLDESKESAENLEWAENLLSEHDLADEISSQAVKENKPEEKQEIKDEDNKSQDEISKKLKELTGDWSEDDDDDDMLEEPPHPIKKQTEDITEKLLAVQEAALGEAEDKEMIETRTMEHEENPPFEDHAELLASLESSIKDESNKNKETPLKSGVQCDNIDEDDIDIALKSLHKEDVTDDPTNAIEKVDKEQEEINEGEKEIEPNPSETSGNNADNVTEFSKTENETDETASETKKGDETAEEKPEEKLLKELETVNESEALSSNMEVDETTKKDLIESLLSEQHETLENAATNTSDNEKTVELEKEDAKKEAETSSVEERDLDATVTDEKISDDTKTALSESEEFLDNTPEKEKIVSDSGEAAISSAVTSTSDIAANEITDVSAAPSTKEDNPQSSEDRVKSLISEWGDDDEDEEDNEADLTANL